VNGAGRLFVTFFLPFSPLVSRGSAFSVHNLVFDAAQFPPLERGSLVTTNEPDSFPHDPSLRGDSLI